MNAILFLIPIALIFIAIAICFFFWAMRTGQYDDLERHASSILFDEEEKEEKEKNSK